MSKALSPSFGIPNSFAPWIVLGVFLIATAVALLDVTQRHLQDQRAQFERQAAIAVIDIEQALSSCELVLHHVVTLIASRKATRFTWRDHVAAISLPRSVLSIQEIGFAKTKGNGIKFIAPSPETHKRMITNTHAASIYPGSGTALLLHELSPDNLSIATYQVPHRRSIDNIALVRHDGLPQSTVRMYLPAYSHGRRHTSHDRRGKLLGYVYAQIGIRELIESMRPDMEHRLKIKLFEGRHVNPDFLLYESGQPLVSATSRAGHVKFSKTAVIDFKGNPWTIQFENSSRDLPNVSVSHTGIYVLGGGLLLAFSLFGVTRTIARAKSHTLPADELVPSEQDRSQQELKNLIDALQTLREEEQKRLAQEMHDDLGQLLAAMKMDLASLAHHVQPNDATALHRLDGINELVNTMMTSVRRIISDLPPKDLEDLGLFAAVRLMAKNLEKRNRIRCHVCLPEIDPRLSQKLASAIYRMIQESLNNVAKHAHASDVKIRMEILDNRIMLSIADNGKGFSPTASTALQKAGSFGLIGMRERAASLNGGMRVESASGEGTKIYFTLPLDAAVCGDTQAITQPMIAGSD